MCADVVYVCVGMFDRYTKHICTQSYMHVEDAQVHTYTHTMCENMNLCLECNKVHVWVSRADVQGSEHQGADKI